MHAIINGVLPYCSHETNHNTKPSARTRTTHKVGGEGACGRPEGGRGYDTHKYVLITGDTKIRDGNGHFSMAVVDAVKVNQKQTDNQMVKVPTVGRSPYQAGRGTTQK